MTHDELLEEINFLPLDGLHAWFQPALRAVVELHKPSEAWGDTHCGFCFDLAWEPSGLEMDEEDFVYPCSTIRVIEKALNG